MALRAVARPDGSVQRFVNAISGIVSNVAWSVETLNDTVDEELAALPEDMAARFVRIAEFDRGRRFDPSQGAAREAHSRPAVGNQAQG